MPHVMEFRILGSLEAFRNGRLLSITAPRQQVLLAELIFEHGRIVPISRLIEGMWDDVPPVTARRQVQICVSSLRKALSGNDIDEVIVTRPPGYHLDVSGERIDAVRFETLVANGRAAADDGRLGDAVSTLRSALSLWRGWAAAGIDSRVVQTAATKLNEQRLAALETCIGLEISCGRHEEVIGELAALVREYPLREKLRAHQMLALHRAGRRADALSAFHGARRALIEELGLEPTEDLQQLEQAILKNDPALDSVRHSLVLLPPSADRPAVIPRQLPTDIADFTGRQDLIEQLSVVLSAYGRGKDVSPAPTVAVLTGMGGVGKTALAVHVAHLLAEHFPDGQLFMKLSGNAGEPVSTDMVFERFLRAFGVAPSAMPIGSIELAQMYRSLLATRRILVVLDDAVSLAQVKELLPGEPNCSVIVTSRQRTPNLVGTHSFDVDVLPPGNAIEMLSQVPGNSQARTDADMAALAELCGFLPLALRIVAAKMIQHPHWTVRKMVGKLRDEKNLLAELQIGDVGVAASISVSYESLAEDAKVLLLRLGLLGASDFASWVCAPLLDLKLEQAEDLLDELVACRLVEVQRGSARFHLHELVRSFAVGKLATTHPKREQANALNRLLGCWLVLVTEAHRLEYGDDVTVLHGSATRWRLPDYVIADLLSAPLAWFRSEHRALISAIEKAAEADLDELCWDMATSTAAFFKADSLLDDWRQTHRMAFEAVRRAHNERGEAAILCSLGELAYLEHRVEDAESDLNRAWATFNAINDVYGRALATTDLGFFDRLRGHGDHALVRYASAVDDLRQVGDQVAAAYALYSLAQVFLEREEYDAAEPLLTNSLSLCDLAASRRVRARALFGLGELFLGRGDLKRAGSTFSSLLDEVRVSGDQTGEACALLGIGQVHTRMRRHSSASAALQASLGMSREIGDRIIEGRALLAIGELGTADGQLSAALTAMSEALNVFRLVGAIAWQARTHALIGRLHLAAGRSLAAEKARATALEMAKDADIPFIDRLRAILD